MSEVPHPAKFSDEILAVIADMLMEVEAPSVLDPFAGTCKIHKLRSFGYQGRIVCNELEPEWAEMGNGLVEVHVGDARAMSWAADGEFSALAFSPVYGNRMSDHHDATDDSKRITYKHKLGRDLTPGNAGMMKFGPEYQALHMEAYKEFRRVLAEGCLLILNVSDFIRKGEVVPVTDWHRRALLSLGFVEERVEKVQTKRMRYGQNHEARVDHESVIAFRRGA